MNKLITILAIALIMVSCKKVDTSNPANPNWVTDAAPIHLTTDNVTFHPNIKYGADERQGFDLFLPNSSTPTGLVIYFHGGGFTGGNKEQAYSEAVLIDSLLANNIAFMTSNYRLIEPNDNVGVERSLNDAKVALQYIRYYHQFANISVDDVVIMGASAGAGTSLWIGLNDDMKKTESNDPILRQSTKPIAIVAIETQATYNLMKWANVVFSEFPQLDSATLLGAIGYNTITDFYGVNSINDSVDYDKFDMLGMIDSNDPDIYLYSVMTSSSLPTNSNAILHHPLHALRVKELSSNCVAHIPNLGYNANETYLEFIIRKLN